VNASKKSFRDKENFHPEEIGDRKQLSIHKQKTQQYYPSNRHSQIVGVSSNSGNYAKASFSYRKATNDNNSQPRLLKQTQSNSKSKERFRYCGNGQQSHHQIESMGSQFSGSKR